MEAEGGARVEKLEKKRKGKAGKEEKDDKIYRKQVRKTKDERRKMPKAANVVSTINVFSEAVKSRKSTSRRCHWHCADVNVRGLEIGDSR